ncbi:MAG: GDYXXLXY domain-containing protein [Gemmataceae bacterium]
MFVPLKKVEGNKFSEPGKLSTHPPAEGTYLRGVSQHGSIRFGIEQYFVQEGKGLRFEDAARRRQLIAKVSVPKDGQAMVLDLEIDPNAKENGPN